MRKICMGLGIAAVAVPVITGLLSNGLFGMFLGVISGVLSGGLYFALMVVLERLEDLQEYCKTIEINVRGVALQMAGNKRCSVCGRELTQDVTSCPSCGSREFEA